MNTFRERINLSVAVLIGMASFAVAAHAEDWPMWGRDGTRNMVSSEKKPPTSWQVESRDRHGKVVQPARNIKWLAKLGSVSMGTPVVAGGLVWVGTNNYYPRDPGRKEDASVLMCFRESDGKFLWQYVSPRIKGPGTFGYEDWASASMGSSPCIEGDRLWLITNRCEALCLDIGPLRRGEGEPKEVWKVDMRKEHGVVPKALMMAMGFTASVAVYKDHVYVVTGNGRPSDEALRAPNAPSLICFNKNSGKVVWQDNSPGKNILMAQRASPLVTEVNGRGQVIIGQGDGWLRSFAAETGKLIWKCDLNPKDAKWQGGERGDTRNYVMATPVFYQNRVYIAPGRDPADYEGEGSLYCINPTKTGDISLEIEEEPGQVKLNPNCGLVWSTPRRLSPERQAKLERDYLFGRTLSTCAIRDGLVYAADIAGYFHCFDAGCGKLYWRHDTRSSVWSSPLWVDGLVYLGTEDGNVWIYHHGKALKEPKKIDMFSPIRASPVFANGVLYITTESHLYAIREDK
jgi:outer membrane protein assembly factor BamB